MFMGEKFGYFGSSIGFCRRDFRLYRHRFASSRANTRWHA
jgi:hypothetical protein